MCLYHPNDANRDNEQNTSTSNLLNKYCFSVRWIWLVEVNIYDISFFVELQMKTILVRGDCVILIERENYIGSRIRSSCKQLCESYSMQRCCCCCCFSHIMEMRPVKVSTCLRKKFTPFQSNELNDVFFPFHFSSRVKCNKH